MTTYNWSDAIVIKAGYIYDRYKYSDAQLNGYQYVVTPTGLAHYRISYRGLCKSVIQCEYGLSGTDVSILTSSHAHSPGVIDQCSPITPVDN